MQISSEETLTYGSPYTHIIISTLYSKIYKFWIITCAYSLILVYKVFQCINVLLHYYFKWARNTQKLPHECLKNDFCEIYIHVVVTKCVWENEVKKKIKWIFSFSALSTTSLY